MKPGYERYTVSVQADRIEEGVEQNRFYVVVLLSKTKEREVLPLIFSCQQFKEEVVRGSTQTLVKGRGPRYSINIKKIFEDGKKSPAIIISKVFDVKLMGSLNDAKLIPTTGKELIIVARVNSVLHFRIFGLNGERIVDADEQQLTEQVEQIKGLKERLKTLWPPHKLTQREKDRVTKAVGSIVGHTLTSFKVDVTRRIDAYGEFNLDRNSSSMSLSSSLGEGSNGCIDC